MCCFCLTFAVLDQGSRGVESSLSKKPGPVCSIWSPLSFPGVTCAWSEALQLIASLLVSGGRSKQCDCGWWTQVPLHYCLWSFILLSGASSLPQKPSFTRAEAFGWMNSKWVVASFCLPESTSLALVWAPVGGSRGYWGSLDSSRN